MLILIFRLTKILLSTNKYPTPTRLTAAPHAGGVAAGAGALVDDLLDVGRVAGVLVVVGPHQRVETRHLATERRGKLENK